jgi:hypothetical protein
MHPVRTEVVESYVNQQASLKLLRPKILIDVNFIAEVKDDGIYKRCSGSCAQLYVMCKSWSESM